MGENWRVALENIIRESRMGCPACYRNIAWVKFYTPYWRIGVLGSKFPNRIIEVYPIKHDEPEDWFVARCPECGVDITESVEDGRK